MKGLSKVLSVLLILSAGFGVFNSTQSIKDILDCKAYWEEEGKISDENLDKLDDGVSQLQENEQAYVDGTKTYEEGLATLTSGKQQLAAGVAEFSAKKAEYEAGVAKIQQLEASGLETYMAGYISSLSDITAYTTAYGAAYNAVYGDTGFMTQIDEVITGLKTTAGALPEGPQKEALLAAIGGLEQYVQGINNNSSTPLAAFAKCAAGSGSAQDPGIISILTGVGQDNLAGLISAWLSGTSTGQYSNPVLYPAYGAPDYPYGEIIGAGATILQGILDNELITGDEATALKPFTTVSTVIQLNVPDTLMLYKGIFEKVQAGLNDSRQKLAEGKVALEEADKLIATNSKKIADGEVELAEGKAKLGEYEDGESQLSDGLNQLMATETYTGLKSIKDRLGNAFSYLKDNGKNIDLTKAASAVKIGREFSADSGVKITNELTTRAIGAGAIIAAAVFALVAGFLGLAKKKGAKILSVLALVAAAAGIIAVKMAGTEMSAIAGSTIAGFSAISGGVVIAVVALVAAIALNAAKNADAE